MKEDNRKEKSFEKLSEKQIELSEKRTGHSEKRTELSDERTELAEERTSLSKERTDLAVKRYELAEQRTHLANQRTFQAWVRTSLALIGFGFGIDKFILFLRGSDKVLHVERYSKGYYSLTVGVIMIFLGILMVILAFLRYRQEERKFTVNHYSYKWLSWLVLICIVVGGAIILYDLLKHF